MDIEASGSVSLASGSLSGGAAQGTGGNCVANPRYSAWGGGYRASYNYAPAYGYSEY